MPSVELSNSAFADVTPRDPPGESSPSDALQMHALVYRGPGQRAWEERPRTDLLHHLMRPLRLLPEADVLSLSTWGLDAREPAWMTTSRRFAAHPLPYQQETDAVIAALEI